jgi:hypothetical protein
VRTSSATLRSDDCSSGRYRIGYPAQHGWQPLALPLREHLVANVAPLMFVLLCGLGLLLLVACVNIAHLVLARSAARRQETAIRQALGASRARLTWQLATESALLALADGALGVLIASWSVRGLTALAPDRIPRIGEVGPDLSAVSVAAALAVTIVFAFVPPRHLRGLDTFPALKDGARGRSTDRGASRTRNLLVAAEVAIATVLLVGAGLLVRTVAGMLQVPVGFATERLVTARITLPRPNDPARAAYLDPEHTEDREVIPTDQHHLDARRRPATRHIGTHRPGRRRRQTGPYGTDSRRAPVPPRQCQWRRSPAVRS